MEKRKLIFVYLSVLVFFGITLTGCGGKSDEEKLEELNKRMENAESLEEIEAIANQIEKLEEKMKNNPKTMKLRLGQSIKYGSFGYEGEKITEFEISFRDPKVTDSIIYGSTKIESGEEKDYFSIDADIKNLGPRKSGLYNSLEVKVKEGFMYNLKGDIKDNYWDSLEAGESGVVQYYGLIPKDELPVEIVGELQGPSSSAGRVKKFTLDLN